MARRLAGYLNQGVVRAGNAWATRGNRAVTLGPRAWLHPSSHVRITPGSTVRIGADGLVDAHTILRADGGHISLGDHVWVDANCYISSEDGQVTFHDDVYVGPGTTMYGMGGLTVGEHSRIGPQVVISAQSPQTRDADVLLSEQSYEAEGVVLGRDVGVGPHATILDGVVIGDGAVVSAGAVVVRSVPEYTVVWGTPARVVGERHSGSESSPTG